MVHSVHILKDLQVLAGRGRYEGTLLTSIGKITQRAMYSEKTSLLTTWGDRHGNKDTWTDLNEVQLLPVVNNNNIYFEGIFYLSCGRSVFETLFGTLFFKVSGIP